MLPKVKLKSECGILNLDNSMGDGTHWTAWFRNNDMKIYFDIYGLEPPLEIINHLKRPIYYSTDCIQPRDTVVCGHLCLYVLKRLSDGEEYMYILNSLI